MCNSVQCWQVYISVVPFFWKIWQEYVLEQHSFSRLEIPFFILLHNFVFFAHFNCRKIKSIINKADHYNGFVQSPKHISLSLLNHIYSYIINQLCLASHLFNQVRDTCLVLTWLTILSLSTSLMSHMIMPMISQSCLVLSSNQAIVSLIVSHKQPIMSHMINQSCLSVSHGHPIVSPVLSSNQPIKSFILITWFLHFPQIVCWRESSLLVFFPNSFKLYHLL